MANRIASIRHLRLQLFRTLLCGCVACLVLTGSPDAGCSSSAQGQEPGSNARSVFRDALAVWHLETLDDSAGVNSPLTSHGRNQLGTALTDEDREASINRGGDGFAALLQGGFLDAGQGSANELQLDGDQFTWLIRLKISNRALWATRGLFTKGGGHDQLVFNFFTHDFEQGPELMRLGFELGIQGQPGLGGQVMTHLDRVGFEEWHDVVARYDGNSLTLFIDGVNLDSQSVRGKLRTENSEPVAVGAGTYQGTAEDSFPGLIDHAAIWQRALTDDEIKDLSGGESSVAARRVQFADYQPPVPQQSTWEIVNKSRELKARFQSDHHRPRYHFLVPEEGDIMPGDPNGAIWWKGRYHLFYIFQRFQKEEPQTVHCWGHASSIDLIHWEHHPTALDVAPDDPDRGIFSGNAFVSRSGTPTILYHGVGIGNSIAEAVDDGLIQWKKSSANPIVPIPRPGDPQHGTYESWDPHGWTEDNLYFAVFGGTRPALFRGSEMTSLQYIGPFMKNDSWSEPVEDISCPDFFPIGNQHMLLCISHCRGARYFLGEWDGQQFSPTAHARMNWPGGGFFAPETLLDHHGRRILWAWCMDERTPQMRAASGWSGVMSLPRILSVDDEGIRIEPAPELEKLRWNETSEENLKVANGKSVQLTQVEGDSLELSLQLPSMSAEQFEVTVRQTPDSQEQTRIILDRITQTIRIDVSDSTLDPRIRYRSWCITRPNDPKDAERRVTSQEAPVSLRAGEPVQLRVFLDHSMLEVFVNSRQCVTQRVWPTRSDATHVSVASHGGDSTVAKLQSWKMAASQPD